MAREDLSADPRTQEAFAHAASEIAAQGRCATRILKSLPVGTSEVRRFDQAMFGGVRYVLALTDKHVVAAGHGWTDAATVYEHSALKALESDGHQMRLRFRIFGIPHVFVVKALPETGTAYTLATGLVPVNVARFSLAAAQVSKRVPAVNRQGASPQDVSWQDAERLAASHMATMGFNDAHLTRSGADGGIDVEAAQAVAQVKHYKSCVGPRPVRELAGVAHGRTALFYALGGYTRAAVEAALEGGVALFQYDTAGRVEPHNAVAQALTRPGSAPKVNVAAAVAEDRQIAVLAGAVAAKARSLIRVRGMSQRQRGRVLKELQPVAELLIQAQSAVNLTARQRKWLIRHAASQVRSGARIAGVPYRKL